MKKKLTLFFLLGLFSAFSWLQAQTNVSGVVLDATTNKPLVGANVAIKGTVVGTMTDGEGKFSINVDSPTPFTLSFSSVGYSPTSMEITGNTSNLEVKLKETVIAGGGVVVSASRVEEKILESPVTIEKMDLLAVKNSADADFYDGLSKMKGVTTTSSSLTFTSINTRGFGAAANERFVQLIDGMDNSSALLNFPVGNVVGISELDVENVELVPGAASALYGPNAFNGILLMNSKSPFDYQGVSAQGKVGFTYSEAAGREAPYYNFALRFAKAYFDNKLAFKVNFSYLDAEDWRANDYTTSRATLNGVTPAPIGTPGFDGMNLYGDDTQIALSRLAALDPRFASFTETVTRTGWREEDLLENFDARSVKVDAAVHYRISDKMELLYNFRYGTGASVYQGAERYVLRDFSMNFNKIELRGDNFFVRGYTSGADAGDSYNLTALGAIMNEGITPTGDWLPNYGLAYGGLLTPFGIPAGNDQIARDFADNGGINTNPLLLDVFGGLGLQGTSVRPEVGSTEYNALLNTVRTAKFRSNGSSLTDDSRVWHGEFNYDFSKHWDVVNIQVGGNVRRYDLFSNGTVYNEDPDGDGKNERTTIDEFGIYTQLSKKFLEDRLKVTGSIRFDKNENFDGQVTPRISTVYSLGADRQHNFRASFQTGFRNPQTQAQFIFFPTASGILLGSTEANAAPYRVHNGGAYTASSVAAFGASRDAMGDAGEIQADGTVTGGDPSLLERVNIPYVKPEQLTSLDIGYKALIDNKIFIDVNYYHTWYSDFLAQQSVVAAEQGTVPGANAGVTYRVYNNSPVDITSQGIGLGVTYKLPEGFTIDGNYSYADFSADLTGNEDFQPGFNTPNNRFTIGVKQRNGLIENFGFGLSYRWQEAFFWENAFGIGEVPAFGVFDAQVNYKVEKMNTTFKIGGSNILGPDYQTNIGGPFVGQLYYFSITVDEIFR